MPPQTLAGTGMATCRIAAQSVNLVTRVLLHMHDHDMTWHEWLHLSTPTAVKETMAAQGTLQHGSTQISLAGEAEGIYIYIYIYIYNLA